MPSDLAENVPATSSESFSLPPAARIRSPLAGLPISAALDALPFHARRA